MGTAVKYATFGEPQNQEYITFSNSNDNKRQEEGKSPKDPIPYSPNDSQWYFIDFKKGFLLQEKNCGVLKRS